MDCLPEEVEDYSNLLLQQEQFFSRHSPIINFIPNDPLENKKVKICPWNEHSFDDGSNRSNQFCVSPGFQHQKQRIQDFLSTIRMKNNQYTRFRTKLKAKKKNLGGENNQQQKADKFVHLNNTILTFPKSKSQPRNLQNEQKIILQKLYRKRQKSKIIPKQIQINPTTPHSPAKYPYPTKNYLSKHRSFIEEHSLTKVYNPESKNIKEISALKRRFSSSYSKKTFGVQKLDGKTQSLLDFDKKSVFLEKKYQTIDKISQKVNSLNDDNADSPSIKYYRTFYTSPKFNRLILKCQKEVSMSKIKEDAKNSHLNRNKLIDDNEIQLLGSTITKWKNLAEEKLKKCDLSKQ